MIRQERLRREWTQAFVANSVGITNATLQRIETGQRKPSYDVLVKLLDLFECDDPRKLFGASPPNSTKTPDGNRTDK